MFSQRIFQVGFKIALQEEIDRKGVSIRELAERAGIPVATLYKITSGERDPRFSTVQAIVNALQPQDSDFVAVIAAKFLLDDIESSLPGVGAKRVKVRGYPAYTMEECIISAVRAEKNGALGIVCAPVLASMIERIVEIPVVIMKPQAETIIEALKTLDRRLEK